MRYWWKIKIEYFVKREYPISYQSFTSELFFHLGINLYALLVLFGNLLKEVVLGIHDTFVLLILICVFGFNLFFDLHWGKLLLREIPVDVFVLLIDLSFLKSFRKRCLLPHCVVLGLYFPANVSRKNKEAGDDNCLLEIVISYSTHVFLHHLIINVPSYFPIAKLNRARVGLNFFFALKDIDCSFSFLLWWLGLDLLEDVLRIVFIIGPSHY